MPFPLKFKSVRVYQVLKHITKIIYYWMTHDFINFQGIFYIQSSKYFLFSVLFVSCYVFNWLDLDLYLIWTYYWTYPGVNIYLFPLNSMYLYSYLLWILFIFSSFVHILFLSRFLRRLVRFNSHALFFLLIYFLHFCWNYFLNKIVLIDWLIDWLFYKVNYLFYHI